MKLLNFIVDAEPENYVRERVVRGGQAYNPKTDIMKDIEKYSSDVFGRKRVLIVDDDKEELFKISDILSKCNVDINTTMSGKDCIYKIKAGEIYNLIIVDDELKSESGLGTLQELKKNKKFNSKVIIMLNKNKEHLKSHYIEDGFNVYQLSDTLEKVDAIVVTPFYAMKDIEKNIKQVINAEVISIEEILDAV